MKKLLLLFTVASIIGLNGLHAQLCTPNISLTQPGFYPDSATGLPHDTVGQPYSTVIQFRVPLDTTITYLNVSLRGRVDSVILINVSGLPSGFTFTCNPASKSFRGDSIACILLTGAAPSAGMVGAYPIKLNCNLYGKVVYPPNSGDTITIPSPIPDDTLIYYTINIDPASTAGIVNLSATRFDLSQNFPDPATNLTNIYYTNPVGAKLDFKMYNLLGTVVYQKSFFAERGTGTITLDAKDFAPGIYMYNLSNGKATLTKRMVMANN